MNKVKIGFIGTGGIANAHLNSLARMEDVEITALCDVVKEKAEAAGRKFGGKVYLDYRRMLDKEKLDALYICVPPFAHQDQELIACQKKIPFFVEKPVTLSLEKAEEQAFSYGHSMEREILFLTVHSVLHLLGYDHIEPDDEKRMIREQKKIMNRLPQKEMENL